MRVGNQEQICVKLDSVAADTLRKMSRLSGLKKNRLINEAILYYYSFQSWR